MAMKKLECNWFDDSKYWWVSHVPRQPRPPLRAMIWFDVTTRNRSLGSLLRNSGFIILSVYTATDNPLTCLKMLSFPAQNWEKALRATKASLDRQTGQGQSRAASRIVPRLYLSDYWTARNAEKLSELGITHIISLLDFKPIDIPESIPQNRRLQITIRDAPDADILQHLDTTTAFIKNALEENEENRVLVSTWQFKFIRKTF